MNDKKLLIGFMLGSLSAGVASAQDESFEQPPSDSYVFVLPSYLSLDEERNTSGDGRGISAGFGQRAFGRFYWEGHTFGNVLGTEGSTTSDFYQYGLGFDLQYRFRDGFSPYVSLGTGIVWNEVVPETDDDRDFFGSAALGLVSGALGRSGVRVRGEARYIRDRFETAFGEGMDDWRIGIGVQIPLGRVVEREVVRERVVREPIPAETIDSDGDGVPDDWDQCPGTLQGIATDARGCAVQSEQTIRLDAVQFELDSATLTPEARESLRDVADALRGDAALRVEIAGHTDTTGPDDYNMSLSQRRAEAVVDYLVELGIERGRLEARGYGETNPVADNSTREGREANRRVEFRILPE